MDQQSDSAAAGQLFAAKGGAQPAGFQPAEWTVPKAPWPQTAEVPAPARSEVVEETGPTGPGSVLSIRLRSGQTAKTTEKPPEPEHPTLPLEFPDQVRNDETAGAAEDPARPTPLPVVVPAPALPPPTRSPGRALALGGLAIACVAAGFWFVTGEPRWRDPEPATVAPEPAPVARDTAPVTVEQAPAEQTAAEAAPITAGEEAPESPPAAAVAPAEQEVPEASFDLVRVEPSGAAVIAGRAAPNTGLIVLHNGEPIGKVDSNWAGEWALIPAAPLPPGEHEFSLVIITPQGKITVPAARKPDAGARLEAPAGEAAVPPLPRRKPEIPPPAGNGRGAGLERNYVVQLSSATSLTGAKQEWQKLQRRFPDLLGDREPVIHQARLNGGSLRYRVRTGLFDEKAPASALCEAFKAKAQDCLVIKR